MRFKKLDLLKFGRFDGAAIELPFAEADLHIVYGDNEAGKSTTLAALEYLLFGFPAQTGFNFKFKNSELRIGATLQSPAAELEFLRRKGHKDTLITADGQPLVDGEKRLAAILEGANQAFYRRHFLLDNRRLREGADELLGAAGDAGKTLLAAGAGIHGLMDVLAGYEARADSLWGKTNKGSREFAIAKGRLKEARDDLKAAEKNHSRYQALKREFESSQTKYHEAQAAVRVLQARQTRLSRIRRVHFDVQALNGAEQEIAGIGDVPLLPVEAAANFTAIEKGLQQNLSRRESYIEQRARLTSAAESSDIDNALLQRSADIDALVEARLVVMAGRGQLPGLLQKSLTLDDEIAGVARDLGWTPLEPALAAQQIVPAPVIDEARALALELATSSERQDAETRRLDEARRRLDEFKALDADGVSEKDSSALRAALAAANADSEVAGRREKAEEAFERAEQSLAGAFAGLTPGVSDPLALRAMAIPARSELDAHRDATVKLRQRVESARDNLHRARLGLAEYKQKQTQVELSLGAMSDAELVGLRGTTRCHS